LNAPTLSRAFIIYISNDVIDIGCAPREVDFMIAEESHAGPHSLFRWCCRLFPCGGAGRDWDPLRMPLDLAEELRHVGAKPVNRMIMEPFEDRVVQ